MIYQKKEAPLLIMPIINIQGKAYCIDEDGFIEDFHEWDEQFAEHMAPRFAIPASLTPRHWDIIYFIRNYYLEKGICPLVYHTCKYNHLRIRELKELFPSGYLRGACRLAGITYAQGYHGSTGKPVAQKPVSGTEDKREKTPKKPPRAKKTYEVDAHGFLIDPDGWDEQFAIHKAIELKMPMPLTEQHWRIIDFLRNQYTANGVVPVVYDICEAFKLEIEDLETLFPDGYHRGAVKLAGLRIL